MSRKVTTLGVGEAREKLAEVLNTTAPSPPVNLASRQTP